ncbi:MAG: GNA1162 family protein [Syntrophales bacterium]
MRRTIRFFLLLTALIVLAGCGSKAPYMLVEDFSKRGARLIAVLPPIQATKAVDPAGGKILRDKVAEELYFKGYPRLPFAGIDERLALAKAEIRDGEDSARSLGAALGVDAVLFISMETCGTSYFLNTAKTTAVAQFALRSAKSGDVLWKMKVARSKRTFHVTRKWLEQDVIGIYEPLLREMVSSALKTLPDGPDA